MMFQLYLNCIYCVVVSDLNHLIIVPSLQMAATFFRPALPGHRICKTILSPEVT